MHKYIHFLCFFPRTILHDILVFFCKRVGQEVFLFWCYLHQCCHRFLSEGAAAVEDETFHRFVEANWQEESGWMGAGWEFTEVMGSRHIHKSAADEHAVRTTIVTKMSWWGVEAHSGATDQWGSRSQLHTAASTLVPSDMAKDLPENVEQDQDCELSGEQGQEVEPEESTQSKTGKGVVEWLWPQWHVHHGAIAHDSFWCR